MYWIALGVPLFVVLAAFWWALKDHHNVGTGHG